MKTKLVNNTPENLTAKEAAALWKNGAPIWSAELGGLGPGYEQAIQILLWEIVARWNGPELRPTQTSYPKEFESHVNDIVSELDKDIGFSGAQVGVAKATAFQFLAFGYGSMMAKLEKDRWILVSKNFPRVV